LRTWLLGASLMLVTAVSGCAAGYQQPFATTTMMAPNVQADVQINGPVIEAQQVNGPVIEAQIGVAQPDLPDLITVTPDVQVVAAYDEPVFFTGGFYYREMNGGWDRSQSHSSGWSSYNDVPYSVRSIENRHSYRNYQPAGYQPRQSSARGSDRSPNYQPRPRESRGYDRPSQGYQQPTGYNRPVTTSRPAYNGGGNGYQRQPPYGNGNTDGSQPRPAYNQGDQPRPATGYQPRPAYNQGDQPRPAVGYQARPSTGYQQPRPVSNQGYQEPRPSTGYQPRPSTGYQQPRPAYNNNQNYQPRPSQSDQPKQNYQPRPSQSYQPKQNYQPRPSQSYQPKQNYQPRPSAGYNNNSSGSSYKPRSSSPSSSRSRR